MPITPRATPAVAAPSQSAPESGRVPRRYLFAPIIVATPAGDYELSRGDLFIGRDNTAQIVLEDPLVSRLHARIVVGADRRVTLEDLQSANGIFVNGIRLTRLSTLLADGDRILLGTTEISLFGARGSITEAPVPLIPPSYRQHSSTVGGHARNCGNRSTIATTRTDPSSLVGQFAETLMASGQVLEAVQTLSDHLQSLLKGAKAGLIVPMRILEIATHQALLLYSWTERATWIDFVFEIHLASTTVPSDSVLAELEPALDAASTWDPALVGYFATALAQRPEPLSPDEVLRVRRLEYLARPRASKTIPPG